MNEKNKIIAIPLDKNLLKSKLSKRKKKNYELCNTNKLIKKNRSNSFNMTELNIIKN